MARRPSFSTRPARLPARQVMHKCLEVNALCRRRQQPRRPAASVSLTYPTVIIRFLLTRTDDRPKVDHMDLSHSLESYFRGEVSRAVKDEGLSPGALTAHYLVQLLAAYAAQPIEDRPLALKLLESIGAPPRA